LKELDADNYKGDPSATFIAIFGACAAMVSDKIV